MNVVLAMGSLRLRQPGPSAPASEVAAWYQAKGRLHEQVAAEGGDDAKQEAAYAAAAYEHARRLLGEAPELAGGGRVNASLFATRHPDLAAAVAAIVDVDWVKRIYRPVRCREDLAFGLAVVESELAWVGWAINGLLVVAKALVDAVESRMLGSHWLVVVGVCLGLSYVGAKGYVRLLWDRRWVKRTLRRVDAGLRPVQDGGAA